MDNIISLKYEHCAKNWIAEWIVWLNLLLKIPTLPLPIFWWA